MLDAQSSTRLSPHTTCLQVNLDGNVLTLSVQQQNSSDKEEERNGVKWHCMERSSQFVQRLVPLPDSADVKAIKVGSWVCCLQGCLRLAGTSCLLAGAAFAGQLLPAYPPACHQSAILPLAAGPLQ